MMEGSGEIMTFIPAVKIESGRSNKVIIRIPYNQELIKKVRTLPGRKWNSKGKYWEVPYDENIIPIYGYKLFLEKVLLLTIISTLFLYRRNF